MLERPSKSAMRSLGSVCARLCPHPARRFSTSPACAVRAIFAETQNADLNSILARIQDKIILPAYLPEKQRERVFNPKMRTHLEQNPIVIEIEGLEHKFSTINRFSDVPNSKTILNQALRRMHTPEDWANLGTLLAGYKRAGIRLPPDLWSKIVRIAGETGNIYAVIECAKQADRTGLRLVEREVAVHVFAHTNDKIVGSGRDAAETRQALRWAGVVLDLMQRPPHQTQLHHSRVIRGLILFTRASAIKAKQQQMQQQQQKEEQQQQQPREEEEEEKEGVEGVEGEQKVEKSEAEPVDIERDLVLLKDEVELLMSLWKGREAEDLTQAHEFAGLNPVVERASSPKGPKIPRALNGTSYMQVLAQNIAGISLARELLGEAAQGLAPVEATLSNHLKEFAQTCKDSAEWAQQYEKIVGSAPQW